MTTTTTNNSVNTAAGIYEAVNGKKTTDTSDATKTQDQFLKLLIQQLKNQDPMNPMDSAATTTQLAQISTVTGVEKLNTTMSTLATSFTSGQSYQAAALIGRSVMAPSTTLPLSGSKAEAQIDVPDGAARVSMTVYDSTGKKVDELSVSTAKSGKQSVAWDGTDSSGNKLPDGNYVMSAIAVKADGSSTPLKTYSYVKVDSVAVASDGVKLNLSNKNQMNFSDVTQIN